MFTVLLSACFTILSPSYCKATNLLFQINIEKRDSLLSIAKSFLIAKEKMYQREAGKEDVERMLNFCTDSVRYDHVLSSEKTFTFVGKEEWRNGAISHLGETKNVRLSISKLIRRQNIVIVEFSIYREIKTKERWKGSTGITVSIIEFDNNKK